MTCNAPTSAHDGRDVRVMTIPADAFGRPAHDVPLCRGCVERFASMGLEVRPGREAAMPVLRDRRVWPWKRAA